MTQKLYFILGCTASGKGSLGRELARRLGNARIVSADSMKVYRRMDIGTAKPTPEQRGDIPHYCIDVVEPSEGFSVAEFVHCADRAIQETRNAGDIALAVGGTNLYIKALSEGLFDGPAKNEKLRADIGEQIRRDGLVEVHEELSKIDPAAAERIHPNDQRRIIRALEVYRITGTPITELQTQWENNRRRYDCVMIGLRREKDAQNRRINRRAMRMIEQGLCDEVAALLEQPHGLSKQAAAAVGYAEMIEHLRGNCTLEEAAERIKINTRRLAKKQRMWQRRFRDVNWFDVSEDDTVERLADRVMSEVSFE